MTITKNVLKNSLALATFSVLFAFVVVVPSAHAADMSLDDMIYPSSVDSYYSPSSFGGDDMIYPSSVDSYYTPSYSDYGDYGYGSSGWMSGFSGGSFGGWSYPGMPIGGGASNSNTNVNTNTNTCTAGSCNTAINAPTTVTIAGGNSNPYPVYIPTYTPTYNPPVVYQQPYPVCNTCGCPGYQACYRPAPQPYVTLAAVPYTGLELGTTGTILYWGFLVLWCLLAAYLIAVKKVQNNIAAWFTGSKKVSTPVATVHSAPQHETVVIKTTAHVEPQFAGIDPFIASQIARTN